MNATKTASSKGTRYTVSDEAGNSLSRDHSRAHFDFAVAGTGNEYHPSGIWFTLHKTREAALKAQAQRGEGEILTFANAA